MTSDTDTQTDRQIQWYWQGAVGNSPPPFLPLPSNFTASEKCFWKFFSKYKIGGVNPIFGAEGDLRGKIEMLSTHAVPAVPAVSRMPSCLFGPVGASLWRVATFKLGAAQDSVACWAVYTLLYTVLRNLNFTLWLLAYLFPEQRICVTGRGPHTFFRTGSNRVIIRPWLKAEIDEKYYFLALFGRTIEQ